MNQKGFPINFNNLFFSHKILEAGSIKAAAKELGMAQSTLCEHLKLLENSLGKKLFIRGKKGLLVTPEGQTLHKYTHLIFKTADRIKYHFSDKLPQKQSIDIGILPSVINSRTSKFLLPLFIDTKIFTKIHLADSQFLIKNLIHGELDVILTDYKLEVPSQPDLENVFLGSIEYVLVYDPKHVNIKTKYNKENSSIPFIQYSILSEARWLAEQFFSSKNIHLDVIGECDDIELAKVVVSNVACCGMLPLNVVKDELESGKLSLLDKAALYKSSLYANYINKTELEVILSAISNLKESLIN